MSKPRQLDISRVPVEHTLFAWTSYIVDDFDLIVISKAQSREVFCTFNGKPFTTYKGIPIKVK